MDRKLSVIANVKYQSSQGVGAAKLKRLLRYFQYRNDRDGHIPQQCGLERWHDKGLGGNFQTIAANCESQKSDHVQAFTLVINPNPDLIQFVPEERRESFVCNLTENTIEKFFEARGIDTPEWAYVVHRRETSDESSPGRDNPHTHVILPGTYESWADGARLPLYFNNHKRENHIEMLHEISQNEIDVLLEREVGLDWEQRYDAFIETQSLSTPEMEQNLELEHVPEPPDVPYHALIEHKDQLWQTWVGVQGDVIADTYTVGLIARYEHEGIVAQDFIPLSENLNTQEANLLAAQMKHLVYSDLSNGMDKAVALTETLNEATPADRQIFISNLTNFDEISLDSEPGTKLGTDIDL